MGLDAGKLGEPPIRTVVSMVLVGMVVVLLGFVLQFFLGDQIPQLYADTVATVVVFAVTVLVVRGIGYLLTLLEERELFTPHQREVSYRFIQLLIIGAVLLVVVIEVWDLSVSNVILGAGVTSVVLALAARQMLTSVLAGINLISTDVFRVGDWVKIDNRFGQINQISLFNTTVRSPQGEVHVFPNDEIIARDITNLGKGKYRNDVLVGIDYETDIDHATALCDSILEELTAERTNNIDGYHPTSVKDFDESQITLAVKIWVEEPRPVAINRAQTTVFAELQRRFAEEQITIPFPQRTLSDRKPA